MSTQKLVIPDSIALYDANSNLVSRYTAPSPQENSAVIVFDDHTYGSALPEISGAAYGSNQIGPYTILKAYKSNTPGAPRNYAVSYIYTLARPDSRAPVGFLTYSLSGRPGTGGLVAQGVTPNIETGSPPRFNPHEGPAAREMVAKSLGKSLAPRYNALCDQVADDIANKGSADDIKAFAAEIGVTVRKKDRKNDVCRDVADKLVASKLATFDEISGHRPINLSWWQSFLNWFRS